MTALSSPSSITLDSESFLNIERLMRSLHMWCDNPESMTHLGATVAARAQAVSQKGSQSPVVARSDVAVVFLTFHHSFIPFLET